MADGIDVLLDWLWEHGIRTGVISNISFNEHTLRRRIESFLPGHHFEFIVASSEYVFRKPSHWIFELALRKAGLPANEVWYCGDNDACDVKGALAAGMQPVWYAPGVQGSASSPGAICCRDWRELIPVLERL